MVEKEVEGGEGARPLVGVQTPGWKRCTICLESTCCPDFLCESDERKVKKIWKTPVEKLSPPPGPVEMEEVDEGRDDKNQNHPKKASLPLMRPTCATCKMSFASVKSLKKHNQHNHTPKQCRAFCGMMFPNTKDERIHFRRKHSREGKRQPKPTQPPPPCELCQRTYHTKGGLLKHMKKQHFKSTSPEVSSSQQNSLPIKCNICEKLFKTRDGVRKHQKTHNKGAAQSQLQATVKQPVQPQWVDYGKPLPIQIDCDPALIKFIKQVKDTFSKKQTVEETLKSLQEAASAEEQKEILKKINIVKTRKVMSKSQLFASDAGLYTDEEKS